VKALVQVQNRTLGEMVPANVPAVEVRRVPVAIVIRQSVQPVPYPFWGRLDVHRVTEPNHQSISVVLSVRESRGTSSLLCRFAFTGLWLRYQKLSPPTVRHTPGSSNRTQGRYPDGEERSTERANRAGPFCRAMRATARERQHSNAKSLAARAKLSADPLVYALARAGRGYFLSSHDSNSTTMPSAAPDQAQTSVLES